MSDLRAEAGEVLEKFKGDVAQAAKAVLRRSSSPLAAYLVELGLRTVGHQQRRAERQRLTAVVRPEYVSKPDGAKYGTVRLTENASRRIQDSFRDFLTNWRLSPQLLLADATRDDLLGYAEIEEKSGKGHLDRARFYRGLAEPMRGDQTVRQAWSTKRAEKAWAAADAAQATAAA